VSWYLTVFTAGDYTDDIPGFGGKEMAMPRLWIKMFAWTVVLIYLNDVLGPIAGKIVT